VYTVTIGLQTVNEVLFGMSLLATKTAVTRALFGMSLLATETAVTRALFGMSLLAIETAVTRSALLSVRGWVEFAEPTVAILELKT
jgi:hypothetical protein